MTSSNHNCESRDSLSYEPRVVAFLDILGFRSFVSKGYSEAVSKIKAIDDALERTLGYIREQEPGEEDWVSIRNFSDCLCLSAEDTYLPTLIDAVATLQYVLAVEGIFVRGGISEGYHCETPRMIFSQALVRAYELQVSDPYPRVLVAPEVVQKMMPLVLCRAVCTVAAHIPLSEYLLLDSNRVCFLDYLRAFLITEASEYDERLNEHAASIARQMATYRDNAHVLNKYLWLAAYHNFHFNEAFDPDDWEPPYGDELKLATTVPLSTLTPAEMEVVRCQQFSRLQVAQES